MRQNIPSSHLIIKVLIKVASIHQTLSQSLYYSSMQGGPPLKIVAISDTHSHFDQFEQLIQHNIKGDIFICAGDFTRYGREEHFVKFFSILEQLQFRHKIVIAGNHEIALDNTLDPKRREKILEKYPCKLTREDILTELRKRCIYLEHELVEIECIRIFGSPHTLYYSKGAFQYQQDQDYHVWSTLPQDIDLLITHSPPQGILDKTHKDKSAGSKSLRTFVEAIKPKLHIFGHIHESHGVIKKQGTTYMNVAKKYQTFEWQ